MLQDLNPSARRSEWGFPWNCSHLVIPCNEPLSLQVLLLAADFPSEPQGEGAATPSGLGSHPEHSPGSLQSPPGDQEPLLGNECRPTCWG